jgi:hypothetical protein
MEIQMRKLVSSCLISVCLLAFAAFSHANVLNDISAFEVQKAVQADFVIVDFEQDVLPISTHIETQATQDFLHNKNERRYIALVAVANNATAYPINFEVGWRSAYKL